MIMAASTSSTHPGSCQHANEADAHRCHVQICLASQVASATNDRTWPMLGNTFEVQPREALGCMEMQHIPHNRSGAEHGAPSQGMRAASLKEVRRKSMTLVGAKGGL